MTSGKGRLTQRGPVDATAFGENVQDSDGEDADDDAGKYTPPSSFTKPEPHVLNPGCVAGGHPAEVPHLRAGRATSCRTRLLTTPASSGRCRGCGRATKGVRRRRTTFLPRPDLGIDTDTGLLLASSTIRLAGLGDEEGRRGAAGAPRGACDVPPQQEGAGAEAAEQHNLLRQPPPPAEEAEEGAGGSPCCCRSARRMPTGSSCRRVFPLPAAGQVHPKVWRDTQPSHSSTHSPQASTLGVLMQPSAS